MKIGKVVSIAYEPETEDHWPCLYAVTEEGRIYCASVRGETRPEDMEWEELSLKLKE